MQFSSSSDKEESFPSINLHNIPQLQQTLSAITFPALFQPKQQDIKALHNNGYITLYDYSTISNIKHVRKELSLQYRLTQELDSYLQQELIKIVKLYPNLHDELMEICEKRTEFIKLKEELKYKSNSLSNPLLRIERHVEKSMKEIFRQRSLLVHVRGIKGIGKLSTCIKILQELKRPYVKFNILNDDVDICTSINSHFNVNFSNICEIGELFHQLIEKGQILLLNEIQNASSNFQSELQQLCDIIDRDKLRGGIIIMGSDPKLVDSMLTYCKPLYGRFMHTFTINSSFNTGE